MFDQNRRKYPRANYPCQLTIWRDGNHHETILANTANIGAGGLAVHLTQDIDRGTIVDIELNFINPSTIFRCKGVVVRSRMEKKKFYITGIQFEPLSEVKLAFLEGKVSELIELEQKGKS